ncbi:TfoX/Sxy family protein [Jiella marina]|uniref:TfoX/Sxy family protein n=1 Tax=Jiella sp. LLJ827 TaxID=2917712 RepID=UPI0021007B6A|nr:TfoX/Sxy family protein [Jiella sp. LLJ827]MCQ0986199.1 TfoX/Sxy family protein [Jiella sp. LLJ827]
MDDEFLRDLFSSLPVISIRRMFGGKGIYSDGRIVAVVVGDELYLKSDDQAAERYEAAGLKRWVYPRPGKTPITMPYYRLPDEAFDDPEVAADWIAVADAAASRASKTGKPKRTRRVRKRMA